MGRLKSGDSKLIRNWHGRYIDLPVIGVRFEKLLSSTSDWTSKWTTPPAAQGSERGVVSEAKLCNDRRHRPEMTSLKRELQTAGL